MNATTDLKHLTTPEKLRLMEALWLELSDSDVQSPEWHKDVLAERDNLINAGEDSLIDWDVAKRQLRGELA